MIHFPRIITGSAAVAAGMALFVFPLWNVLGILLSIIGLFLIAAGFREARLSFIATIFMGVGILYLLFAAGIMAEAVCLSLLAQQKGSGGGLVLPRAFFIHSLFAPTVVAFIAQRSISTISWKKTVVLWLILYLIYPSVLLATRLLASLLPIAP